MTIESIDFKYMGTLTNSAGSYFKIVTMTYNVTGVYDELPYNVSSTGYSPIGSGDTDFSINFRNLSLPTLPSGQRYAIFYRIYKQTGASTPNSFYGKNATCPSTYPNDNSQIRLPHQASFQVDCGGGDYAYFQPYMAINGETYTQQPRNYCLNSTTLRTDNADGSTTDRNCIYECQSGSCKNEDMNQTDYSGFNYVPRDQFNQIINMANGFIIFSKNWENFNLTSIKIKMFNDGIGNPLSCTGGSQLNYSVFKMGYTNDNRPYDFTEADIKETMYSNKIDVSGDGTEIDVTLTFPNVYLADIPNNERYALWINGCSAYREGIGLRGSSSSCVDGQADFTYGQDSDIELYRTYYMHSSLSRNFTSVYCSDDKLYFEEPYLLMAGTVPTPTTTTTTTTSTTTTSTTTSTLPTTTSTLPIPQVDTIDECKPIDLPASDDPAMFGFHVLAGVLNFIVCFPSVFSFILIVVIVLVIYFKFKGNL
jgi:hypothetical protein